mmetsp:Transcript_53061/g.77513  ORF Transcript_53061/g.77513 Transcript_53061/m.77513 type:complete len:253 (-) Transcript_53061:258-1016(-)
MAHGVRGVPRERAWVAADAHAAALRQDLPADARTQVQRDRRLVGHDVWGDKGEIHVRVRVLGHHDLVKVGHPLNELLQGLAVQAGRGQQGVVLLPGQFPAVQLGECKVRVLRTHRLVVHILDVHLHRGAEGVPALLLQAVVVWGDERRRARHHRPIQSPVRAKGVERQALRGQHQPVHATPAARRGVVAEGAVGQGDRCAGVAIPVVPGHAAAPVQVQEILILVVMVAVVGGGVAGVTGVQAARCVFAASRS